MINGDKQSNFTISLKYTIKFCKPYWQYFVLLISDIETGTFLQENFESRQNIINLNVFSSISVWVPIVNQM